MEYIFIVESYKFIPISFFIILNNQLFILQFVTGSSVVMLWNWHVEGAGEMFGACVAMFITAILYEGLKYLRERLLYVGRAEKGECNGPQCNGPPTNVK